MEDILVLATGNQELVIIKDGQVTQMVSDVHDDSITQILVLTDYQLKLSFVTLSLDGNIKFWNDEGVMEQHAESEGIQFFNGCVVPN